MQVLPSETQELLYSRFCRVPKEPDGAVLTRPASRGSGWSGLWFKLVQIHMFAATCPRRASLPDEAASAAASYYDNTNFSILQGVIEEVSGMSYIDFATKYVLTPAGLNPAILSATPEPQSTAALTYSGPGDTRQGYYWGPIGFIGPTGWISSARELAKLIAALRGTSILPASVVSEMFTDGIGWYTSQGAFGSYFQHNGSIGNGLTPSQRLNTCVFHFAEGYDMALISDSVAPVDVTVLCQGAFDSRGLPASGLPANGPAITSVVHGASYLPKVAPGSYVSIIGSGFSTQSLEWSGAIGSGTTLPIEVSGIQVRVGSQFVYVEYVSPGQVNFLLPSSVPPGVANVELTTVDGGMTTSVEIDAIAPGLFRGVPKTGCDRASSASEVPEIPLCRKLKFLYTKYTGITLPGERRHHSRTRRPSPFRVPRLRDLSISAPVTQPCRKQATRRSCGAFRAGWEHP